MKGNVVGRARRSEVFKAMLGGGHDDESKMKMDESLWKTHRLLAFQLEH